jgi:hypothetical protein
MDLEELIRKLQTERSALDEIIGSLEAMRSSVMEAQAAAAKKRRGRKSMSMEERQMVAERIKKYWATMTMEERRVAADRMKKYWARRRQAKLARDPGRSD